MFKKLTTKITTYNPAYTVGHYNSSGHNQLPALFNDSWFKSIFGDLEKAFEINFYVGIIFMFYALFFFLRKIETSIYQRVIFITFLGLFLGSGAYHGFYWILPSFYMAG